MDHDCVVWKPQMAMTEAKAVMKLHAVMDENLSSLLQNFRPRLIPEFFEGLDVIVRRRRQEK